MEKQAKKRHLSFLSAKMIAHKLYALDMKEDDFVEMAYEVWRDIGNIGTKIYRFFCKVPSDYIIELPQQAEFINSVTIANSSIDETSTSLGSPQSLTGSDLNQPITTSYGQSLNYNLLNNNSIKITSTEALNKNILIIYRSIDLGEDGLPLLNDKEAAAIAAEVTKRESVRKGFLGVGFKDKISSTMLQYIMAESTRLMTAAKINENISDDAIDKMLDIKTSWDRKVFGSRFRITK